MKKIFLTFLIFSVVSCSVSEVPLDSLVERNGITYQVNSDKPYSGKAIEYYANGQAEYIETYKKGKIAQEEQYYENGQLEWRWSCEGGIENDMCPYEEYVDYWENGQLASKSTYKNGEVVQEEQYYENGNKIQ